MNIPFGDQSLPNPQYSIHEAHQQHPQLHLFPQQSPVAENKPRLVKEGWVQKKGNLVIIIFAIMYIMFAFSSPYHSSICILCTIMFFLLTLFVLLFPLSIFIYLYLTR